MPENLSVLIVDGCPVTRETLRSHLLGLHDLDVRIEEASSAVEALQLCARLTFDCALIEYHLPEDGGPRLLSQMRDGGHLPFAAILLTGSDEDQLSDESLECGAHEFLNKETALRCGVRAVVGRSRQRFILERDYRKSEADLRALFDCGVDATVIVDEHGEVRMANRSAQHLLSRDDSTLVGQPFLSLLTPQQETSFRTVLVAERPPAQYELDVVRSNGASVPVEMTVSKVRSPSGNVTTCILRDISERRQLQAERTQQRRFIERITDSVPVSLFVHDVSNYRILFGNGTVMGLLGYPHSPDQTVADQLIPLVCPDDQEKVRLHLAVSAAGVGTEVATAEFRARHRDGRQRWILSRKRVLRREEDGLGVLILGMAEDITERKKREEQLQTLSLVARESTSAIIITDAAENILYVNPSFERTTGFLLAEALGRKPGSFLQGPLTDPSNVRMMREAVASRTPIRMEVLNYKKDGSTFWIEIFIGPVLDDHGACTHFVAVQNDISNRKRTEQKLAEARKEAEQAARAKGEFLATMSHEIRTPMNGIIGMTGLMLGTSLSSAQQEYVETIRLCGESLLGIINDILDFSKIDAGKMELEDFELSVRSLCEESLDLVSAQAGSKGLELVVDIADDCPERIMGDPGRLRQILLNLLSNAVKFTDRGEVCLRVEVNPGAQLAFAIADTGIGIPVALQSKLFTAFSQADGSTTRKYGGTGLGLAISQRLAQLMKGEISFSSAPDAGSTFCLEIPFRPAAQNRVTRQVRKKTLQGKNVLLIVGNSSSRAALGRLLRRSGAQVHDLAIPEEGPLHFSQSGPQDVIVLDQNILDRNRAGVDGLALLRQIRCSPALIATPVVLLHRHTDPDIAESFPSIGAIRRLAKPIHAELLLRAVERAADVLPEQGAPSHKSASGQRRFSGAPRILVAEDNSVNQRVARLLLENMGCLVDVVGNGLEAVAAVKQAPYDAVLMDCQMPELDGYSATGHIRAQESTTRLPVIALTAHAMDGERERCLEAGMDEYLSKPVDAGDLYTLLKALIRPR
ncbi:MAG: response regulator [Bryobacteraceae bacterium]|nr:response regulator [Bryobacteraceae bacterium]